MYSRVSHIRKQAVEMLISYLFGKGFFSLHVDIATSTAIAKQGESMTLQNEKVGKLVSFGTAQTIYCLQTISLWEVAHVHGRKFHFLQTAMKTIISFDFCHLIRKR